MISNFPFCKSQIFATLALFLFSFTNLYASSECLPVSAQLLAHYQFDNSLDSLAYEEVSMSAGSALNVRSSSGVVGSSFRFNVDSQVLAAFNNLPVRARLSISVWVKPSSLDSVEARFFSQATGVQNDEHILMGGAYNGSALRFRLNTNGTTTTLISPQNQLAVNKWSFVTFVYTGTMMHIYNDGILVASTAKTGEVTTSATIPFAIGNQPPGAGERSFLGEMDDLRIYGGALQEEQIMSLMNEALINCNDDLASADTLLPEQPDQSSPLIPPPPAVSSLADGWPIYANEGLPMAGVFYGQHEVGLHTGNARIAYESSRRFRAEKSGYIDAIRYNNRTLDDATIAARCNPSAPDSLWCKCVNNDLDRYSCGYTLSNSYSVGNGGSIVVEIREDDGSSDGHPVSAMLGRTAGVFVPLQRANEHYPILPLTNPVRLEAGKTYHLVFTNLNPPTHCRYSGVSISRAASCPRRQGAMGLNGYTLPLQFGDTEQFGPFAGSSPANLVRSSRNAGWAEVGQALSWYEVRYADGSWVGDSHVAYGATSNGRHFIAGNTHGRQLFTVRESSRVVDGLWVNHGHSSVALADGSPMKVLVKNDSGNVLAVGSIESSSECASAAVEGKRTRNWRFEHCRVWSYTDLSDTVNFVENQRYSVEFSASASAGFSLHTSFPLNYGPFKSSNRNVWEDAKAEISRNNGRSWTDWSGTSFSGRDINLLFTIEGMPKQLP